MIIIWNVLSIKKWTNLDMICDVDNWAIIQSWWRQPWNLQGNFKPLILATWLNVPPINFAHDFIFALDLFSIFENNRLENNHNIFLNFQLDLQINPSGILSGALLTLTNSAEDPIKLDELLFSISADIRIFSPGINPLLLSLTLAVIGPLLQHRQQMNFESSLSIGN